MRQAIIIGVCALVLVSCSGDPNENANKLFVEVQKLIEKAEKQNPEEKLQSLLAAEEKLKAIVAKYPAANLAVQLASGQSIGKISSKSVATATSGAAWAVCMRAPKRVCVLHQAVQVAESIEDKPKRAEAFGAIGEIQSKSGLAKEVAATLDQAVQLVPTIDEESKRGEALSSIAAAHAKAGRSSELLQLASSIKNDRIRVGVLASVAKAQAKAGLTKEASDTINQALRLTPSVGDFLPLALASIAEAQAIAGLTKEAAGTFDQALRIGGSADGYLVSIVEAQAHAALTRSAFDQAIKIAQSITDGLDRALALRYIVEAQAKAGNITDALQVFQFIDYRGLRDEKQKFAVDEERAIALLLIVDAYAKAGKIGDALNFAQSIPNQDNQFFRAYRAIALGTIAVAQTKAGLTKDTVSTFEEALRLAHSVGDNNYRSTALANIAEAQAQAGKIPEALSLSQAINNGYWRAYALWSIADALPKEK